MLTFSFVGYLKKSAILTIPFIAFTAACKPKPEPQSSAQATATVDTFLKLTQMAAQSLASRVGGMGAEIIHDQVFGSVPYAQLSEESYKRIEILVKKGVAEQFLKEVKADWEGFQSMEVKGYSRSLTDPARSLSLVSQYCTALASMIPKLKSHGVYGFAALVQATALYRALSEERITLLYILGQNEEAESRAKALRDTMSDIGDHFDTQYQEASKLYAKELQEFVDTIPKANPRTGLLTSAHCLKIPNENACFTAPMEGKKGLIALATADVEKRRFDLKSLMGGEETMLKALEGTRKWQSVSYAATTMEAESKAYAGSEVIENGYRCSNKKAGHMAFGLKVNLKEAETTNVFFKLKATESTENANKIIFGLDAYIPAKGIIAQMNFLQKALSGGVGKDHNFELKNIVSDGDVELRLFTAASESICLDKVISVSRKSL